MKEDFRKFLLNKVDTFVLDLLKYLTTVKIPTITEQIIRSGTSIGANVHEGQSAFSRKELARFLEIALRSGHETSYWLFITTKLDDKLSAEAQKLIDECHEIERILYTSITSLRRLKLKN